jgi:ankyrin repeat protein
VFAARKGHHEAAIALLAAGQYTRHACMCLQITDVCLHRRHNTHTTINTGANPNLRDFNGNSAIAYASKNGHLAIVQVLCTVVMC